MKNVVKQFRQKRNVAISWMCALAMTVTIFAALPPMTADAAASSFTQAQAVAWANAQIGKSLDYDGAYGAQCVDLIKYYYNYLGHTVATGNAADYNTSSAPRCPTGWSRVTSNPQPGDVIVWGTSWGGGYGHIGIVVAVSGSNITTVEQNINGNLTVGGPATKMTRTSSGVVCYLRPNFSSSGGGTPSATAIIGNIGAKINTGGSGNANVRASASTSAASLGLLAHNTSVTITGWSKDSSNAVWFRVTTSLGTGFVRNDLITSNTVSLSGTLNSGISGTNVNIRQSPVSGSIVASRANGTAATVTGIVGGSDGYAWYRISSPNAGFVRADLILK